MNTRDKRFCYALAVLAILSCGGCGKGVGVGMSVNVPVGDHAHVSVHTNQWVHP